MTTLTIMRQLPREIDPLVYNMTAEDPGNVSYSSVGGLSEQIRELREVRITLIPKGSFIKSLYHWNYMYLLLLYIVFCFFI